MANKTGANTSTRILVVDDDATVRFLAREALEPAGFTVDEADDGAPALSVFQKKRPDIVLLDIMMHDMNGFETCSALRQLPGGTHTPVLMMTGLEDRESIERAYEVGATDFVVKPINSFILTRRLQHILRANRYLVHFDGLTGLPRRDLFLQHLDTLFQKVVDVLRKRFVTDVFLHGLGPAQHVHNDYARTRFTGHFHKARIVTESRNIVDDLRARLHRGLSHRPAPRIDGNDSVGLPLMDTSDDRYGPPDFFLHDYRLGTGPRGFTSHIDDLSAGPEHFHTCLDSRVPFIMHTKQLSWV